jgi:hypothetical protein
LTRCFRWLGRVAAAAALAGSGGAGAADPQVDYMLECQGCHLYDGSGAPGRVPDLRDSVGRFLTVPGGREYLVRVPGAAQSPLGDAELAEVLNWMIRRFGPAGVAAEFEPYSAPEVARLRTAPLPEVDSVRGALVRLMRAPAQAEP